MIIRFKFYKKSDFKYLSHLDVLKILSRSIARAGIKASLSSGFNPRPRLTLSNPIPLGVQSYAEYADIVLEADMDIGSFIRKMNSSLPEYIRVAEALKTDKKIKNLMSLIDIVLYEFLLEIPVNFTEDAMDSFIEKETGGPSKNARRDEGAAITENTGIIENTWAGNDAVLGKGPGLYGKPASDEITDEPKFERKGKSIYKFDYNIFNNTEGEKIFLLKIFGYAKIFNNGSNRIFKFNDFYKNLTVFSTDEGINILSVQKTGVYALNCEKLQDPFEAVK